jgi:hypothetical protein
VAALGVRDRVMGVDAEARRITLDRFRGRRGRRRLERAYRAGWLEAKLYCSNCWQWGRDAQRSSAAHAAV